MPTDASEVPEDQLKELSTMPQDHMHMNVINEDKSEETNDSAEEKTANSVESSESSESNEINGEDEQDVLESELNQLDKKFSVKKLIQQYLEKVEHNQK